MTQPFRCTLVTPDAQVFDDSVIYASIPAYDGQMGVAHQRAPLLAKLGEGPLRLDLVKGGSKWFFLSSGFAQMLEDKLTLLTEKATLVEEIVRQDAEKALRQAQERVAVTDDEVADKTRQLNRARGMLALIAAHSA